MGLKYILFWAPLAALTGLICWGAAPAAPQPEAGALPTPYPETRYQLMSGRSPFAVATSTATAAPTPGFAAQLYVDGVAHALGTDFVAIKSRDQDKPEVYFLEVGESSKDGMKVERVAWSDQMGKSTVDVSKGGERATLEFDEATVHSGGTGPGPGLPGMVRLPTLPMGQGRPMNFPAQGNGQPQFNNRFFQPPTGPTALGGNQPARRVRGLIPSQ